MSPYYDQPGLRQRGPEDDAGVLVLFACAAVGLCWYVAVSRLHLRNAQCLEIFLHGAIPADRSTVSSASSDGKGDKDAGQSAE